MLRYLETMAPSMATSISDRRTPRKAPYRRARGRASSGRRRPTVEDLADLGRAGEADKAHARSHKSSPIGRESPVMTLKTPLGTPAFSARAASASAECGVSLVGFSTMVQPAASAGHTLRVIIELRKFHGVMAPQTPIGGLIASSLASGRGEGIVSP